MPIIIKVIFLTKVSFNIKNSLRRNYERSRVSGKRPDEASRH